LAIKLDIDDLKPVVGYTIKLALRLQEANWLVAPFLRLLVQFLDFINTSSQNLDQKLDSLGESF
jgi:hypothetical protein